MDYWRAEAGRSQGKETVKRQFREENLLRSADVRGNARRFMCTCFCDATPARVTSQADILLPGCLQNSDPA